MLVQCTKLSEDLEIMYINMLRYKSINNLFIFGKLGAMSIVHFRCRNDSLVEKKNIMLMPHEVNVDVVTFKETETTAL